jgi:hypothetical protein
VSKTALPNSDFSAEIKLQYTHVTFWGTGIALSELAPTNGGGINNGFTIAVWQDRSLNNMRVGFGGVDVYAAPINTNNHVLRVERRGSRYYLYLDGQLIFTSPDTAAAPRYIWMGNPASISPYIPDWTRFNVDYVRVALP